MNEKQFVEKYCHNCGTQRCEGIGTEWFEGCPKRWNLDGYGDAAAEIERLNNKITEIGTKIVKLQQNSSHPKLHKCEECYSESVNERCPHCHPPYDHFGKYYIVGDYPNDPGLHVLRRDDALGGVMIDYCPMCGRKLED